MKKVFIIRKDDIDRRGFAADFIHALDMNKNWKVTIEPFIRQRTNQQSKYIHAVPLKMISDHTGEEFERMKEYLCGMFTGWIDYKIGDKEMSKPVKTTSQMNVIEMKDFIEWLMWYGMDKLGLYIPSPNEYIGYDESTIPTDS